MDRKRELDIGGLVSLLFYCGSAASDASPAVPPPPQRAPSLSLSLLSLASAMRCAGSS